MFRALTTILCFSVPAHGWPRSEHDFAKGVGSNSAGLPAASGSRIIGGQSVDIEEYPFAVSLQNNGTFFGHEVEHFCGGSIIGERWIITSAQCARRLRAKNFHVRAGTKCYYRDGAIYGVESAAIHPKFDPGNYDYDVGLVKLSEKIIFDKTKQPVKLPKSHSTIADGTVIDVVGWGATNLLGPMADNIKQTKVPKISNNDCAAIYDGLFIPKEMFCVFQSNVGPCVGDSGSAAVSGGTLFGVASWRDGCTYQYPSAYANVAETMDWITEMTGIF